MALHDPQFGGINHLALVCKDMARTVDFYEGVLGMPLVKTIELPQGMGQHYILEVDRPGHGTQDYGVVGDAPEKRI